MNLKTTEGSGCKFEKNSVNCPCKDGDTMPRKERDYKAEAIKEKQSITVVRVKVRNEKCEAFDAKIALNSTNDNPITRTSLINKWIDMYLAGTLE